MTITTKIRKGTEVWLFLDADYAATVSISRLTITSLGRDTGGIATGKFASP